MKILPYIIGLILLANVFACQRETTYPLAMQQAESLMNTRPDSTLYLLQGMADNVSTLPEEAQMYYHLLTIQAKDKQYITHTSDSLINRIVSFYEEYNDNDRLMMAYYYQGRVYRDMSDAPRALKAFQRAEKFKSTNSELLTKVYSQMGYLFSYQGLYNEAIRANKACINVFRNLKQETKEYFALRDIARVYEAKEMEDSALHYYKKCYNIVSENKDSVKLQNILSDLGRLYYNIGKTEEAKDILLNLKRNSSLSDKSHIDLTLGYIYKEQNLWDSACFHFQQVLLSDNKHKQYYSHKSLFSIEYIRGNHSLASEYAKEALAVKEEIDKVMQTEDITKINSLYNYQHTEEENLQLKLTNESQKNKILLSLFALVCTITLACSIFSYQRKKSKEALRVAHILGQLEAEKHKQSLVAIKENEQKIAELSDLQKEAKHQNNHLLQELTLLQKEMMELRNREIKDTNNNEAIRIKTFEQSSLYGLLKRASINDKINISAEDWNRIQSTLDFVYPHFRKRLQDLYPNLSIIEEQVCWLIKLSINPAGIARIVKRSNSAISNIRARLHKKIHKASGNSKTFDEIIKNL